MVRVHCDEGVANHISPEPCVRVREGTGGASAGGRAGQPLSRESPYVPGADAVTVAEGNTTEALSRAFCWPGKAPDRAGGQHVAEEHGGDAAVRRRLRSWEKPEASQTETCLPNSTNHEPKVKPLRPLALEAH